MPDVLRQSGGVGTGTPEPWETAERDAFRVRFDEDPDAYHRTRPVAPTLTVHHLAVLTVAKRAASVQSS